MLMCYSKKKGGAVISYLDIKSNKKEKNYILKKIKDLKKINF